MPIENFSVFIVLSFSIFLFSIFLWLVQYVAFVYRAPLLLRGRFRLFRLRDELRRLYLSVQCREIEGVEFHDGDFTEIETRINNAINVLPLLSRRFIYLYMEGPEMRRFIEENEKARQNLLERYANTPIGEALKEIDEQISDILYCVFCLNSPIYVIVHYIAGLWKRLRCRTDYQVWREREVSRILQLLMDIPIPVVDLANSRFSVNSSRLLSDWSKMPEA
jgi:hypothetical protein